MTVKKMIETLMNKGHKVKFTIRQDGSARITEIDGQAFTASKGNAAARDMLGQSLSKRQMEQANRNVAKQKGKKRKKKKKNPMGDEERELRKLTRRVQKAFREAGDKGTIRWSSVAYAWKHYGIEEALEKLTQAERYAKGLAYPINLQHFVDRLRQQSSIERGRGRYLIEQIARYIEERINAEYITEYQLQKLIEIWYLYIQGTITIDEWFRTSKYILQKHVRELRQDEWATSDSNKQFEWVKKPKTVKVQKMKK